MLEARDRVGGRTWSRPLGNGATIEMGAEFILPGNTEVRALAAELGLGLWDKGMRYGKREPRGGLGVSDAELADGVAAVAAALAELDGRPTARELLDSLAIAAGARGGDPRPAGDLLRQLRPTTCPRSTWPASPTSTTSRRPSVAGGNQGLALALAARLPDAGRARRSGRRGRRGRPGEVRVRTAPAREVEADACVVAVPASVGDRIRFEPELPPAKVEALARVRYGHAAKLFVPLAEPVAPSAVMNVPERWWCWTATGAGDEPMPVVSCFAGSAPALERLELGGGPGRWLESLAALRPSSRSSPRAPCSRSGTTTRGSAPPTRSRPRPSSPRPWPSRSARLRSRASTRPGRTTALMEGAIRSGRRAAADLVQSAA